MSNSALLKTLEARTSRALNNHIMHIFGFRPGFARRRGIARAADMIAHYFGVASDAVAGARREIVEAISSLQHPMPDNDTLYATSVARAVCLMDIDDITDVTEANRPVLVTRHEGTLVWFEQETGLKPVVVSHVDNPATLRGRVVVGVLPFHVAATIGTVWVIEMPRLPSDWRGRDLSPADMDQAGARLVCYRVRRVATQ